MGTTGGDGISCAWLGDRGGGSRRRLALWCLRSGRGLARGGGPFASNPRDDRCSTQGTSRCCRGPSDGPRGGAGAPCLVAHNAGHGRLITFFLGVGCVPTSVHQVIECRRQRCLSAPQSATRGNLLGQTRTRQPGLLGAVWGRGVGQNLGGVFVFCSLEKGS